MVLIKQDSPYATFGFVSQEDLDDFRDTCRDATPFGEAVDSHREIIEEHTM